jgi:hypothetical protein
MFLFFFVFDISEIIRLATYIEGSLGKLRTFSGRRLSPNIREEFEVFKEMAKTLRCCAPEGPPLVAKVVPTGPKAWTLYKNLHIYEGPDRPSGPTYGP